MAMKAVKIALILLLTVLLVNWMRVTGGSHIVRVLPFVGGKQRPALFEVASVIMIVIALWGWARLKRGERRSPARRRASLLDDAPDADQDDDE
jgi:hypothetical protein